MSDLFNDAVIIHTYTRAQAIEDGVLVDVSEMACEAGIRYPVALTSLVWHEYVVPDEQSRPYGQSEQGRLWDLLWMFRTAAQRSAESLITFKCYFIMKEKQKQLIEFKAHCGPGDQGEPVITIMLPWED